MLYLRVLVVRKQNFEERLCSNSLLLPRSRTKLEEKQRKSVLRIVQKSAVKKEREEQERLRKEKEAREAEEAKRAEEERVAQEAEKARKAEEERLAREAAEEAKKREAEAAKKADEDRLTHLRNEAKKDRGRTSGTRRGRGKEEERRSCKKCKKKEAKAEGEVCGAFSKILSSKKASVGQTP